MTLTRPAFAIACVLIALAAALTTTVIAVSYKLEVFSSSTARGSSHSLAAVGNEAMCCSLLALSLSRRCCWRNPTLSANVHATETPTDDV